VRLLDIACGPARGCQFLPRVVVLGVWGAYLVVGHVLFDDHLDFDLAVYLNCWDEKNALEGTEYSGGHSVE
jgi:hypothetical protein